MSILRKREWIEEMTFSSAMPDVVGSPAPVLRKRSPNLINHLNLHDRPKKRKRKRLVRALIPLQSRI